MRTRCEISFGIEDVTAREDATLSSSPVLDFSEIHELHQEKQEIKRWATLEGEGMELDGSYLLFPDQPKAEFMGLWSREQSDENGNFSSKPSLEVKFTKPHSSLGITLCFSQATEDWAKDVTITWKNAQGGVMTSAVFQPDSGLYFCSKIVESYYGLTITFGGTNKPYHWLKLTGIRYGVNKVLSDKELTSASLLEEVDPISNEVRIGTLGFSFYYADGEFDLLNMSGAYALFQERQKVEVIQYLEDTPRFMGNYYLSTVTTGDNQAEVACTDLIGVLMESSEYMGGYWPNGIKAGALLKEIMKAAKAEGLYQLDPVYENVMVKGYLPICSPREALQQLAFVLGAGVTCARREKIWVFKPPEGIVHTIEPYDKAEGHSLSLLETVTGVEVYTHSYNKKGDRETELFKETKEPGDHLIRFSSMADQLRCVGGTIVESGINHALLRVTQKQEVTLFGYGYDSTKTLEGTVKAAIPVNGKENIFVSDSCTLTVDPQALAQRIYDYKQLRIKGEGSYFPLTWAPGERALVKQSQGKALLGWPVSMRTNLFGGGITEVEVIGNGE